MTSVVILRSTVFTVYLFIVHLSTYLLLLLCVSPFFHICSYIHASVSPSSGRIGNSRFIGECSLLFTSESNGGS
jgi:hypothetical protein